ncbi:MAG: ABC transporter ATP-binding protein [Desulfurococcales archaeon]|nr:ABC transporter ATP-binding protein [Desulfurococcales archaeon]
MSRGSVVLEVDGVEASYGEAKVLFGVTFKVEKGVITALLGSNGSGKSTTLWAIMGAVPVTSGSIKLLGEDITHLPTHKRVEKGLVLVPEGRRLWPQLTVYENLILGASTPRARAKLEENLEMVFNLFPRLKERRNQLAGTLSGGEQQMLAIARGLMAEPEVLMLDEPSLGLAPKLVQEIAQTLKRLRDEEGKTILLAEQNVHISLQIADYAYVMEQGRVVLKGTAKELEENPKLKAAYLGL